MKNKQLLDLCSDYLIGAFEQTTATGLSSLLDGEVRHDQVQRMLAGAEQTVDDGIAEKPYADENEILYWHYDHALQRHGKGINFVTCLYHSRGISLPVGFELIWKPKRFFDPQIGKEKRRADRSKNEICCDLLHQAVKNRIPFRCVLNDIWFASAENMNFVKLTLRKRSSLCRSKATARWR